VVLIPALVLGLIAGGLTARWNRPAWQIPEFRHTWLVAVFFLPQLLALYLPVTRSHMTMSVVAACLITSQVGLLLFCVINKHLPGIPILATGLFLNLLVISANGGFMPLSTATAAQLIPEQVLKSLHIGSRFSVSSKDILLTPEAIILPWLSDRFVAPDWLPYRFALVSEMY
jgi:uncharacterized membrane protein YhhN